MAPKNKISNKLSTKYLEVSPDGTLAFFGPFHEPKITFLRLYNFTRHRIAFKFRTDVPLLYKVTPKCGFVESGQLVGVRIIMRPFDDRCLFGTRLRHRFILYGHPCGWDWLDPVDFWRENIFMADAVQQRKIEVLVQPVDLATAFKLAESYSFCWDTGSDGSSSKRNIKPSKDFFNGIPLRVSSVQNWYARDIEGRSQYQSARDATNSATTATPSNLSLRFRDQQPHQEQQQQHSDYYVGTETAFMNAHQLLRRSNEDRRTGLPPTITVPPPPPASLLVSPRTGELREEQTIVLPNPEDGSYRLQQMSGGGGSTTTTGGPSEFYDFTRKWPSSKKKKNNNIVKGGGSSNSKSPPGSNKLSRLFWREHQEIHRRRWEQFHLQQLARMNGGAAAAGRRGMDGGGQFIRQHPDYIGMSDPELYSIQPSSATAVDWAQIPNHGVEGLPYHQGMSTAYHQHNYPSPPGHFSNIHRHRKSQSESGIHQLHHHHQQQHHHHHHNPLNLPDHHPIASAGPQQYHQKRSKSHQNYYNTRRTTHQDTKTPPGIKLQDYGRVESSKGYDRVEGSKVELFGGHSLSGGTDDLDLAAEEVTGSNMMGGMNEVRHRNSGRKQSDHKKLSTTTGNSAYHHQSHVETKVGDDSKNQSNNHVDQGLSSDEEKNRNFRKVGRGDRLDGAEEEEEEDESEAVRNILGSRESLPDAHLSTEDDEEDGRRLIGHRHRRKDSLPSARIKFHSDDDSDDSEGRRCRRLMAFRRHRKDSLPSARIKFDGGSSDSSGGERGEPLTPRGSISIYRPGNTSDEDENHSHRQETNRPFGQIRPNHHQPHYRKSKSPNVHPQRHQPPPHHGGSSSQSHRKESSATRKSSGMSSSSIGGGEGDNGRRLPSDASSNVYSNTANINSEAASPAMSTRRYVGGPSDASSALTRNMANSSSGGELYSGCEDHHDPSSPYGGDDEKGNQNKQAEAINRNQENSAGRTRPTSTIAAPSSADNDHLSEYNDHHKRMEEAVEDDADGLDINDSTAATSFEDMKIDPSNRVQSGNPLSSKNNNDNTNPQQQSSGITVAASSGYDSTNDSSALMSPTTMNLPAATVSIPEKKFSLKQEEPPLKQAGGQRLKYTEQMDPTIYSSSSSYPPESNTTAAKQLQQTTIKPNALDTVPDPVKSDATLLRHQTSGAAAAHRPTWITGKPSDHYATSPVSSIQPIYATHSVGTLERARPALVVMEGDDEDKRMRDPFLSATGRTGTAAERDYCFGGRVTSSSQTDGNAYQHYDDLLPPLPTATLKSRISYLEERKHRDNSLPSIRHNTRQILGDYSDHPHRSWRPPQSPPSVATMASGSGVVANLRAHFSPSQPQPPPVLLDRLPPMSSTIVAHDQTSSNPQFSPKSITSFEEDEGVESNAESVGVQQDKGVDEILIEADVKSRSCLGDGDGDGGVDVPPLGGQQQSSKQTVIL